MQATHIKLKIDINVSLPSDFPEKYKKPLLKTVESCTVKKAIQEKPEFNINITNQ